MKKVFIVFIVFIAAVSVCGYGIHVHDEKDAVVRDGTCGENVNWTLSADGLLTISGEEVWLIILLQLSHGLTTKPR